MAGLLFVGFLTLYKCKANLSTAIHGDKQQNERDWVLNEFKTGKSPIMVATDVASRGIGMIDCKPALSFAFLLLLIDAIWFRISRFLLSAKFLCYAVL